MTELQEEYLRNRNRGHRHTQALTRTAKRYGLTVEDVATCLTRAESIEATGFFGNDWRQRQHKTTAR